MASASWRYGAAIALAVLILGSIATPGAARQRVPRVWLHSHDVTTPYARPRNATTRAQRLSVQGKACESCGKTAPRMHADHHRPLVQQHYAGTLDPKRYHALDAVRPQCPECSGQQGGLLVKGARLLRKAVQPKLPNS